MWAGGRCAWWRQAGHLARMSGAASRIMRVSVVTAGLLDDSLHRESTSSIGRRSAACSSAAERDIALVSLGAVSASFGEAGRDA